MVDDEPFCIDVVVSFLKFMEINKIKTAFNWLEEIKMIKEEESKGMFFNIILIDCNMGWI